MEATQCETLAIMRAAIGFLGEREQYAWWQSSFFSAQNRAFLAPVFGRTQLLAQTTGVTRAASLVHDERIGVGRVFHLFRLPEDIEQGIHQALQQPAVAQRVVTMVADKAVALRYLLDVARATSAAGVGPTRIGDTSNLRDARTWRTVAAQYAHAFTAGDAVFPFYTDQL
jgi:hypothetical protein